MNKYENEIFDLIVSTASEAAHEEDSDMVVGKIQGSWVYCHIEDTGRRSEMINLFIVDSAGLKDVC